MNPRITSGQARAMRGFIWSPARHISVLPGREAVAEGQRVIMLIAAANRDPEIYDHPDVFDIHRERAAGHLAFGGGIHYCIGQPLARLEATVALQMLAQRMPELSRTGPVRRVNSGNLRGPLRNAGDRRCRTVRVRDLHGRQVGPLQGLQVGA